MCEIVVILLDEEVDYDTVRIHDNGHHFEFTFGIYRL